MGGGTDGTERCGEGSREVPKLDLGFSYVCFLTLSGSELELALTMR